jgi:DNA-binding response OmpR family regulator
MKALVADDSATSRKILSSILHLQCGFEDVEEAENGEEAVRAVKNENYDLIMMDWNMPRLEGIDALRAIRKLGSRTPVIMVTAVRERQQVMRAFHAGANNYIVKPINPQSVIHKVAETLERARSRPQPRRKLKALIADDSRVFRRVLAGTLRDKCGFQEVAEAENGREAVQLAALQEFDLILLDWNMPEMQGIDALREIRASGSDMPIVMVTSEKEGARVVEALDAGANNYIIKPFEPETLAHKVGIVMQVHG